MKYKYSEEMKMRVKAWNPKSYRIDIDKVQTVSDIKEILELLNIQVSEFLLNDKNKHLFKEV